MTTDYNRGIDVAIRAVKAEFDRARSRTIRITNRELEEHIIERIEMARAALQRWQNIRDEKRALEMEQTAAAMRADNVTTFRKRDAALAAHARRRQNAPLS